MQAELPHPIWRWSPDRAGHRPGNDGHSSEVHLRRGVPDGWTDAETTRNDYLRHPRHDADASATKSPCGCGTQRGCHPGGTARGDVSHRSVHRLPQDAECRGHGEWGVQGARHQPAIGKARHGDGRNTPRNGQSHSGQALSRRHRLGDGRCARRYG